MHIGKVLKSRGNTSYISGLPWWTKSFFRQVIKQPQTQVFQCLLQMRQWPRDHRSSDIISDTARAWYLIRAPRHRGARLAPSVRWLREINVSASPEGESVCFKFPLESFGCNGLWFFPREAFRSSLWSSVIGKDELATENGASLRKEGALEGAVTFIYKCGQIAGLCQECTGVSWEARAPVFLYL